MIMETKKTMYFEFGRFWGYFFEILVHLGVGAT